MNNPDYFQIKDPHENRSHSQETPAEETQSENQAENTEDTLTFWRVQEKVKAKKTDRKYKINRTLNDEKKRISPQECDRFYSRRDAEQ